MDYVRNIDLDAMNDRSQGKHLIEALYDRNSGAKHCAINCISTPVGGGSLTGMHYHDVDQIFYILQGTMSVEIEDQHYECPPGTLVIFPAGVKHRNWNGGSEATIHLAINAPQPDPGSPFMKQV